MDSLPLKRDRVGRLHCFCGKVMGKMTMEYPDRTEEWYVCVSCFKDGSEAYMEVKIADEEYPDWNKDYREKQKKFWANYRKRRKQNRKAKG